MAADKKIQALQGVRGLACIMVFLSHSYDNFQLQNVYLVSLFADFGRLGVLLFFVLSGFLEGMKSSTVKPNLRYAIDFVYRKIRKVYLWYLLAEIAMFILLFKSYVLVEYAGGTGKTCSKNFATYFNVAKFCS